MERGKGVITGAMNGKHQPDKALWPFLTGQRKLAKKDFDHAFSWVLKSSK